MNKQKKYKIVWAFNPDSLEDVVNAFIDDGYDVSGSVVQWGGQIGQPMVRRKQEDE